MSGIRVRCCLLLCAAGFAPAAFAQDAPLRAAFGEVDITPAVDGKEPVWIAGYGPNRPAKGVHDRLMARGLVLADGGRKFALVCVDLVGLQYPAVQRIRAKLPGFDYVMVSSTHNHEGPDVIGIWGKSPFTSGVDERYIDLVVDKVVALVDRCETDLVEATAVYGTAEDDSLLGDSRLPKAFDGVLRALRFNRKDNNANLGVLVQWNCHPESLGSKNQLLTADFPFAAVAKLKEHYKCPVAYFTGAVGGLMAPPDHRFRDSAGKELEEGDYEYARVYGEAVANLAVTALYAAKPLQLTPLEAHAKPIALPVANPLYQLARTLNVVRREGRVWTGDFEDTGEAITPANAKRPLAVVTEVAYLRLGELHVACLPGEIYPELVYGKFQEPAEPNVDFPDAPLETPISKLLPLDKSLIFGLANDEIGYIIPKRQWDDIAPFAYGRDRSQYGEINSCGPESAPILMKALENRIRDAQGAGTAK